MFEQGKHRALYDYCQTLNDTLFHENGYKGPYDWLKEIALQLKEAPDSELEVPGGECVVPLTAYPSPLLRLPVRINGVEPSGLFVADTGAPFTLLSYQTAQRCNVRLMPNDTITCRSAFGLVPSVPGFIDELKINGITFRNIYAHVALQNVPEFFRTNDIIGLRELSKFSSVTVSDRQVTFKKEMRKAKLQPNMRVIDGQLFVRSSTEGNQAKEYLLNTGSDQNFINGSKAMFEWHNVLGDSVMFTAADAMVNPFITRTGLLGLSYLMSFDSCTLDFDRMRISGQGYKARPYNHSICLNSNDYASLEAYWDWYAKRTDEMGRWLMHAYMSFMKNRPQQCVHYIDSLFMTYAKQLETSTVYLKNLRAAANVFIGNYAPAIQDMKDCVRIDAAFNGMLNKCVALQNCEKSLAQWNKRKCRLSTDMDDKGIRVKGKINKTKSDIYFAPDKTESLISPSEAAKRKMKIITYKEDSTRTKQIAVADIELGGMRIRNAIFSIDEKADGIYLGNSTLRLIPQYTIEPKSLTLYSDSETAQEGGSRHSLFIVNYLLYYYRMDEDKPASFSIGAPYPNAQTVPLKELIRQNAQVTVNMKEMYIDLLPNKEEK